VKQAVLIAVGVAVTLATAPARGYVRTTSEASGAPVQWNESCVVVTIDQRGSRDVPLDQVAATLQRAVDNWTKHTATCGGLRLSMTPARAVLDVAPDGLPALIFRNTEWRRPGHAPHDPSAIGLTTVMYVNTPGIIGDATILDADIELNNVNYTFTTDPANATARPGTQLADLENTLTHELGHVQGLAHTCWDHITPSPPHDNSGNPIPDCNDPLPESILATTMYPYATMPGEISKRNLAPDDSAGVCEVYAPLATRLACRPEIVGGYPACSVAPAARERRWLLAVGTLLMVGWLAVRRRRG
jgi:hypothetical protein